MNLDLRKLTPEEEKKIREPDPDFTFSDAVLWNALECVWQFLEHRGAKRTRYESSVELRLTLRYLGHELDGEPDETRMLRTTANWSKGSWEVEEHGFFFEFDGGKVSCTTIPNHEKARQELFKYLLSLMAICGTKAEWKESMKAKS